VKVVQEWAKCLVGTVAAGEKERAFQLESFPDLTTLPPELASPGALPTWMPY